MLQNTEKKIKCSKLINFVNRENKFKIKTGYRQRLTLYNRTNHVNVKYHKPPVWNCHSEDKHSISIGILIPNSIDAV